MTIVSTRRYITIQIIRKYKGLDLHIHYDTVVIFIIIYPQLNEYLMVYFWWYISDDI